MNLEAVREKQLLFENNLQGTDMSLADLNTPEYSLKRGIIGEAFEALESLEEKGELSDEFRNEVVDIYIFFATLLNHIGMSQEELETRTRVKVTRNFIKYRPDTVAEVPILEGMQQCRDNFNTT